MINTVLKNLIPEDKTLNMPSADKINFDNFIKTNNLEELIENIELKLNQISNEKSGNLFMNVNKIEKIQILNELKLQEFKLFSNFIFQVFKAYYTNINVIEQINKNSQRKFT